LHWCRRSARETSSCSTMWGPAALRPRTKPPSVELLKHSVSRVAPVLANVLPQVFETAIISRNSKQQHPPCIAESHFNHVCIWTSCQRVHVQAFDSGIPSLNDCSRSPG